MGDPKRVTFRSMRKVNKYVCSDFAVVAYEGDINEQVNTSAAGGKRVIQYVQQGVWQRKWNNNPPHIMHSGQHRDTFTEVQKDAPLIYRTLADDTINYCIIFKNRMDFPYTRHNLRDGEVLEMDNNGKRPKLIITVKGGMEWLDEAGQVVDTQDQEIDHRELVPGDTAEGRAVGETHLFVVS